MCAVVDFLSQAAFPHTTPSPATESLTSFWARFAFKEPLGKGNFGEVWRCVERATGRSFACKEIEAKSPKAWRRIAAEVGCMRALSGHTNVVQLYEVHEDEDRAFLVLELCSGGDLFEAIADSSGGIQEGACKKVFEQVAQGLKHCHVSGFLHRDIKPENVLLIKDEAQEGCHEGVLKGAPGVQAKLADFGLAERVDDHKGAVRGRCGSEQYAAPEVAAGEGYSFPADIWSLGVVLFTALKAEWPQFDEHGCVIVNDLWEGLSPDAVDLILWMLLLVPSERPTIEQVLQHPWLTTDW